MQHYLPNDIILGSCGTFPYGILPNPSSGWSITDSNGIIVAYSGSPDGCLVTLSGSDLIICVSTQLAISNNYIASYGNNNVVYTVTFNIIAAGTVYKAKHNFNYFYYLETLENMKPIQQQTITIDLSDIKPQNFDLSSFNATYLSVNSSTPSNVTTTGFYPPDVIIEITGLSYIRVPTANTAFIPIPAGTQIKGTVTLINNSTVPSTSTPVYLLLTVYR